MDAIALRPAAEVMAPDVLGAACSHALSFARVTMRDLSRGNWKLERLRADFDADGNGELLYRFHNDSHEYHFFVLSKQLTPDQKLDRNFANDWDAKGALCYGPWSPERDAYTRRELEKMRSGRVDYDTFVVVRANRSDRLFSHVIERLAAGGQPDAETIASVGYLMRTTGFTGNGALGTRPFKGIEAENPLAAPFAAQILTAYLLREYSFDLVEQMARARNSQAVTLAPAFKRYLGVGNSAATGLVAYFVNHPQLVNSWCLAREIAYARAKARPLGKTRDDWAALEALLVRAVRYFAEDEPQSGPAKFTPSANISEELQKVLDVVASLRGNNSVIGQVLCDHVQNIITPATMEVLHSILLELQPDITEEYTLRAPVEEGMSLDPLMTTGELLALIERDYEWALRVDPASTPENRYFWYRSTSAPLDVRRGIVGMAPQVEIETNFDTCINVRRMHDALRLRPVGETVAEFLASRPEFRGVAARVQTLKDCPFGELRDNPRDERFSPFGAIRFVLSFFGLEKFDPAQPKSVRGALLQGAPLAAELERGMAGDWPFVTRPSGDLGTASVPGHRSVVMVAREAEGEPSTVIVAPIEIRLKAEASLNHASGMLGVAVQTSQIVLDSAIFDGRLHDFISHVDEGRFDAPKACTERQGYITEANGASALLYGTSLLEAARVAAMRDPSKPGVEVLTGATGGELIDQIPWQGKASRSTIIAIRWDGELDAPGRIVVAAPFGDDYALAAGAWQPPKNGSRSFAEWEGRLQAALAPERDYRKLADELAGVPLVNERQFVLISLPDADTHDGFFENMMTLLPLEPGSLTTARERRDRLSRAYSEGVAISRHQFEALNAIARRVLVDTETEKVLRTPGFEHVRFL